MQGGQIITVVLLVRVVSSTACFHTSVNYILYDLYKL